MKTKTVKINEDVYERLLDKRKEIVRNGLSKFGLSEKDLPEGFSKLTMSIVIDLAINSLKMEKKK